MNWVKFEYNRNNNSNNNNNNNNNSINDDKMLWYKFQNDLQHLKVQNTTQQVFVKTWEV